ncbi:hypothetical protein MJ585_06630 [Klebsiella pneumoniae]|nr:hypothetical protein MJ585_06630 [Klebsiella pneumoniae]
MAQQETPDAGACAAAVPQLNRQPREALFETATRARHSAVQTITAISTSAPDPHPQSSPRNVACVTPSTTMPTTPSVGQAAGRQ